MRGRFHETCFSPVPPSDSAGPGPTSTSMLMIAQGSRNFNYAVRRGPEQLRAGDFQARALIEHPRTSPPLPQRACNRQVFQHVSDRESRRDRGHRTLVVRQSSSAPHLGDDLAQISASREQHCSANVARGRAVTRSLRRQGLPLAEGAPPAETVTLAPRAATLRGRPISRKG